MENCLCRELSEMTTIYANIYTGEVYADSRCTITRSDRRVIFKKKEQWFDKSMKIYQIRGMVCAIFGTAHVSQWILDRIQEKTINQFFNTCLSKDKHEGNVVIVKKGYAVVYAVDKKGYLRKQVLLGIGWITAGSGSLAPILRNLDWGRISKIKDPLTIARVLKYNSLFDKYSDADVVYAHQAGGYYRF